MENNNITPGGDDLPILGELHLTEDNIIIAALKGDNLDVPIAYINKVNSVDMKSVGREIVRRYNEYEELKDRYFTADQIRIIQEQAYDAGFFAGQGMK